MMTTDISDPSDDASSTSSSEDAPRRRRGRPPGSTNNVDPSTRAPRGARADKAAEALNARVEALREPIEQDFAKLGMVMLPAMPVTGTVMIRRAPAHTETLLRLAKVDPRVLRILEGLGKANVYGDALFMAAVIGVAVAVDRHLVNPTSLVATGMVGREVAEVELMRAEIERAQSQAAVEPVAA